MNERVYIPTWNLISVLKSRDGPVEVFGGGVKTDCTRILNSSTNHLGNVNFLGTMNLNDYITILTNDNNIMHIITYKIITICIKNSKLKID
jgi:hypothetical protein